MHYARLLVVVLTQQCYFILASVQLVTTRSKLISIVNIHFASIVRSWSRKADATALISVSQEKELAEVNEIKCSLMDNLEAAKTLNTGNSSGCSIPSKLKKLLTPVKLSSKSSSFDNKDSSMPPVSSTCSTPYTAMHTKSSLMRLQAAQESSASKASKCLDQSCFANSNTNKNLKRKSGDLMLDTRATKKRKAATKKRPSLVIKRSYETRSRLRKK